MTNVTKAFRGFSHTNPRQQEARISDIATDLRAALEHSQYYNITTRLMAESSSFTSIL